MRVHEILENSASNWPGHPAIIDDLGSIDYQTLYRQTRQLTETLRKAGLEKGQGLVVVGRNSRRFVIAMFAGMACGATVLPLSHQLKQAELQDIIETAGVHAIIDDGSGVGAQEDQALSLDLEDFSLQLTWLPGFSEKPAITPLDAAFIRYTSGTTGTSKGVVLTHDSLMQRIETAQLALNLSPDEVVLWVLPMAFHFLVTIMVYLRYGATLVVCKDLLGQTLMETANQFHATLLYAAPMHFRLLAADQSDRQVPTLRRAISTSSALPETISKQFYRRFKLPVAQAYGIIEAGLPLLDTDPDPSSYTTVGWPTKKFSVGILDDHGRPVTDGETGHLAIKGPGMFDAYLTPWRTARAVMHNGWFMTGDLACKRSDARIIICGREKTMINVAGNKAFPEEIEAVLNSHPDITDSLVYGQEHPLMGEVVCARVVLRTGRTLDSEALSSFCRLRLSTYKVPQRIQQVDRIPHTRSGKIKRAMG